MLWYLALLNLSSRTDCSSKGRLKTSTSLGDLPNGGVGARMRHVMHHVEH